MIPVFARFSEPYREPASGACHSSYSPLKYSITRPHIVLTVCALQPVPQMQLHKQVYGDFGANDPNRPLGNDRKRQWTYGLFDCFGRCGLCT